MGKSPIAALIGWILPTIVGKSMRHNCHFSSWAPQSSGFLQGEKHESGGFRERWDEVRCERHREEKGEDTINYSGRKGAAFPEGGGHAQYTGVEVLILKTVVAQTGKQRGEGVGYSGFVVDASGQFVCWDGHRSKGREVSEIIREVWGKVEVSDKVAKFCMGARGSTNAFVNIALKDWGVVPQ